MKITVKTIEYDYKDSEEFARHKEKMFARGWGIQRQYAIDEKNYKLHVIYASGWLYNGVKNAH